MLTASRRRYLPVLQALLEVPPRPRQVPAAEMVSPALAGWIRQGAQGLGDWLQEEPPPYVQHLASYLLATANAPLPTLRPLESPPLRVLSDDVLAGLAGRWPDQFPPGALTLRDARALYDQEPVPPELRAQLDALPWYLRPWRPENLRDWLPPLPLPTGFGGFGR